MGVYLIVIGLQDIRFRKIYNRVAHEWMSSWLCTAAGVTALLSFEVSPLISRNKLCKYSWRIEFHLHSLFNCKQVSIFILLLVSAERYLLIASPLKVHSRLTKRTAFLCVFVIWIFTFILSIVPGMFSVRYYKSLFLNNININTFLEWINLLSNRTSWNERRKMMRSQELLEKYSNIRVYVFN
jgi:leucine-rich repeat-containing G protein-coupled receptor 8